MNEKVALLYSGGSDSTLAAAVLTEKFDELHLLTFYYSNVSEGIERSKVNVERLRNKFMDKIFVHHIMNLDKLYKEILYGRYILDLIKYRFFVLAMCPICKIAMFTRTLVHCLDNDIRHIADGANRGRGRTYPEQVRKVMKEFEKFLGHYGVEYSSPVYDMPVRTDELLFEMGLYPSGNVKYDPEANRMIEGNCNLKSLYHTVSQGYYVMLYGHDKFEEITIRYYRDKFGMLTKYIDEYLQKRENSKLFKLINE